MNVLKLLAAAVLSCAALTACQTTGGEGEPCKSAGILGPLYCDGTLLCNGAAGNVCEEPRGRRENEPCDADALCATGLWCEPLHHSCQTWLHEGDHCLYGPSCGPDLACTKNEAELDTVCGPMPPDDGPLGTSVNGTLTLPEAVEAKGTVAIYTTPDLAGSPVASTVLASNGATPINYRISGVPAGSYFIFALLDVDRSGGSLTPGDYSGWYGQDSDGNPPATANAVVPESGSVSFDFNLVLK